MSNASTLLHYFGRLATACNVRLDSDAKAEIEDIVESIESDISDLRDDVRELKGQLAKARAALG